MGNVGSRLLADGLISDSDLRAAEIKQRETGSPLGLCLVDLGHIREAQLYELLAEEAGVPFVNDERLDAISPDLARRVPSEVAALYQAVPVEFDGDTLVVATSDPTLVRHLAPIGEAAGALIRPAVASRSGMAATLLRLYDVADTTVPVNTGRAVPTLGGAAARASPPSLPQVDTVRDAVDEERSVTEVDAPDHLKQLMRQYESNDAHRAITQVSALPDQNRIPTPVPGPDPEDATMIMPSVAGWRRGGAPATRDPSHGGGYGLPETEPSLDTIGNREDLNLHGPPPSTLRFAKRRSVHGFEERFDIVEKLGKGGMAEVFKAVLKGVEGFHRTVVIKRILPHLMGDKSFVEMFIDEANIACQLSHPNIAQVYELAEADGRHYIVMEYVEGVDLQTLFARSAGVGPRISPAVAAYIIEQLCEGLDYAHGKLDEHHVPLGIVHRDVNPANVLIDYDGHVKVIDFGIAKAKEKISTTQVGALKGKPGYFAPEQAQGDPLDGRADVFAVGIILYELLLHERLFRDGATAHELRQVIEFDPRPKLRFKFRVPGTLRAACLWALLNDRDERCPTAGDLAREMREYLRKRRGDPRQELVHYIRSHLGPDAQTFMG